MSVVLEFDGGWFVDHLVSINKDVEKTDSVCRTNRNFPDSEVNKIERQGCGNENKLVSDERQTLKYECNPNLFAIWQPFMMDSQFDKTIERQNSESSCTLENKRENKRKRKRKHSPSFEELVVLEEHKRICCRLTAALNQLKKLTLGRGYDSATSIFDNNLAARRASSVFGCGDILVRRCQETVDESYDISQAVRLDELSSDEAICNRLIENPYEVSVRQTLMGHDFLISPQSKFLISDLSNLEPLLIDHTLYDCVVIDPPWENKSVKRKKKYNMLSERDLLNLPIRHLCSQNALVLFWVTNKQRQQKFVTEQLFPAWNIRYLTKWYWLKVTKTLQPVCKLDLDELTKRPYECLLLGCKSSQLNSNCLNIPPEQVIISVPCSIHSRKPPLNEILQKYLIPEAKCLELFARSLLPKWTSWGNEVLALQHIDFFQQCAE